MVQDTVLHSLILNGSILEAGDMNTDHKAMCNRRGLALALENEEKICQSAVKCDSMPLAIMDLATAHLKESVSCGRGLSHGTAA